MRRKILVTLAIGATLAIGLFLAYATATNWPFTTSGDYTYDADKIEVAGGVARIGSSVKAT